MVNDIQFLQDLQDFFAEKLDLSIVITDMNDQQVTVPSYSHPFDEWLLRHRKPLIEADGDIAWQKYLENIKRPILMNLSIPGIKVIVSPIQVNQVNLYFVWAGVMIQENAHQAVMNYIHARIPGANVGMDTLKELPQPSAEATDRLLLEVARFAKLSSQYLRVSHTGAKFRTGLQVISSYMEQAQLDQFTIGSVLKSWMEKNQDIHFCGIAKEFEDEKFRIETYWGPDPDLKHAVFSAGEGFLGQAALYSKFREWNYIDKDPRIQFFTQRGIIPHHLFCAPIIVNDKVSGVLFAGSLNQRPPGNEVVLMLQVIFGYVSALFNSAVLKQNLKQLNTYLMVLMEIAKTMHLVQDVKRIQLILVDMSLNLAPGVSACFLLLKSTDANRFQIVSRGLSQRLGETYGKDMVNRYFHAELSGRMEPKVVRTDWEDQVIECPVYSYDKLLGVLAVSMKETVNVNEYIPVFSALACLAGIAIERAIQAGNENHDQHVATLLTETISYWDKDAYHLALEAHQLADEFTKTLDFTKEQSFHIATACLLHPYSPEFLRKHLKNEVVPQIVEGWQMPQQQVGKGFDASASSVVTLILAYLTNKKQLSAVQELRHIPEPLKEQFVSFMMRKHTVDSELTIGKHVKENHSLDMIDFAHVRQMLNISSREADVLKLIVHGLNNREIAQTLFISENTVKNHITNLFQKLAVSDRAQAIALVYKIGFHHCQ